MGSCLPSWRITFIMLRLEGKTLYLEKFSFPQNKICTTEALSDRDVLGYRGTRAFELPHDKTNKMTACPAKTQISMGIRPV